MIDLSAEYIAAGANRHPSAADWDSSGIVAFGADTNIALWRPQNCDSKGVFEILSGHTDIVNVVKFVPQSEGILLSGSVDRTIRVWKRDPSSQQYCCIQIISSHRNSLNCIAVAAGCRIFATGSADATIKIFNLDNQYVATLKQSIQVKPRFFPLALALSPLIDAAGSYVLAAAGTKDIIQLYICDPQTSGDFRLQATLSGHEGWIRSLEFSKENESPKSDLLLSSASQDKYIRLWRIHQGKELPAAAASQDPSFGAFLPGKSLSNKAHRFKAQSIDFSATFEALLLGHEDWIYSTKWRANGQRLQLLSASADNSLAIWEPDSTTGVWVIITRLGEISAEKGSTTATGSTGGFWTGLWSPAGTTVTCLGRTGSWRLWNLDQKADRWTQGVGVGGHTQAVTGVAWSKGGDYLLSTSSDQTTRLHAKWKRGEQESWHEMARPQIHGYDLNCIDSLGTSQFVSGAEEKLLRVFNEPKAVASLLAQLCGIGGDHIDTMPDAANMPVLGLSNKAVEAAESATELQDGDGNNGDVNGLISDVRKLALAVEHPPLEDQLSRHTLWPETEKLYGHGYEISCLAASHDGSLVATACKASSIDHAVIRLFETKTWHEIKPPLKAHSLTVTRLRFSPNDQYLLSVSRDRDYAIFKRELEEDNTYTHLETKMGHSRMILDAAWVPTAPPIFATAGRDKKVKVWSWSDEDSNGLGTAEKTALPTFSVKTTISEDHPVTAIDFRNVGSDIEAYFAVGTEVGIFKVYGLVIKDNFAIRPLTLVHQITYPCPLKAITQLAWKPSHFQENGESDMELAIASEDSSLRIYSLKISTS